MGELRWESERHRDDEAEGPRHCGSHSPPLARSLVPIRHVALSAAGWWWVGGLPSDPAPRFVPTCHALFYTTPHAVWFSTYKNCVASGQHTGRGHRHGAAVGLDCGFCIPPVLIRPGRGGEKKAAAAAGPGQRSANASDRASERSIGVAVIQPATPRCTRCVAILVLYSTGKGTA